MKRQNTPAAMEKIRKALDHIQNAQAELGRAAQELSSLRFGSPQQQKVMKLYNKVHAHWYVLREFSMSPQSLSVDSEPEPGKNPRAVHRAASEDAPTPIEVAVEWRKP